MRCRSDTKRSIAAIPCTDSDASINYEIVSSRDKTAEAI